jgi:hypothetical protein
MTAYYAWAAAAFAVIAALAVMIRYLRRRKKGEMEPIDLREPWEIAFEKLAMLKEKRYLDKGEYKQYYFELTELARELLGRIYRLDVLEMTTDEFVEHFADVELPGGMYSAVEGFLRHADLVKFAKLVPEAVRAEDDYILVHDIIADARSDYERRRQVEMQFGRGGDGAGVAAAGGVR